MNTPRGYVRDAQGHFVWPGQTVTKYEQNFTLGESLPSWLTTSNSTSSTTSPAGLSAPTPSSNTEDGFYRVGTKATPDPAETAVLFGPQLWPKRFTAIHWEIRGLQFNDSYSQNMNAALAIGIQNVGGFDVGGRVIQGSTAGSANWDIRGGGAYPAGPVANYNMRVQWESYRWRNLGFLMLPQTGELFLTESGVDNVIDRFDATERGMIDQEDWARPMLQMTLGAGATVPKAMRICGVRLTLAQH